MGENDFMKLCLTLTRRTRAATEARLVRQIKNNENIFTISETTAMMRMVTSKGAPLEPGLFGSEEIARNEKAAKSLKTNDPAKS
jgi:hypothetical protein